AGKQPRCETTLVSVALRFFCLSFDAPPLFLAGNRVSRTASAAVLSAVSGSLPHPRSPHSPAVPVPSTGDGERSSRPGTVMATVRLTCNHFGTSREGCFFSFFKLFGFRGLARLREVQEGVLQGSLSVLPAPPSFP
ncbi:MAG: hypothetical protein FD153_1565, partial [Rhodospirillaceae bacterium]